MHESILSIKNGINHFNILRAGLNKGFLLSYVLYLEMNKRLFSAELMWSVSCMLLYFNAICAVCIQYQQCTVVDIKKRDTRCYSDTYHRREMKLVLFFITKCPL